MLIDKINKNWCEVVKFQKIFESIVIINDNKLRQKKLLIQFRKTKTLRRYCQNAKHVSNDSLTTLFLKI